MRELARSNEPVFVSWLVASLADAGIDALVFDQHTSIVEGSIGVLPRRIMVLDEDYEEARRILDTAPDLTAEAAEEREVSAGAGKDHDPKRA